MQFGKLGNLCYSMDVQWQFSLLQAFAIALSKLYYKLVSE